MESVKLKRLESVVTSTNRLAMIFIVALITVYLTSLEQKFASFEKFEKAIERGATLSREK